MSDIQRFVSEDRITILVGNKIDAEEARTVSFDEGAQLAEKPGLPFFEISAKTVDGVEKAMNELISLMTKASEGKNLTKCSTDIKKLKTRYCTESKQRTCLRAMIYVC